MFFFLNNVDKPFKSQQFDEINLLLSEEGFIRTSVEFYVAVSWFLLISTQPKPVQQSQQLD